MGVMPKIMGGYVYNKGSLRKSLRSLRSLIPQTRKRKGGASKKGGRKKKKRKTKKAGCGY